MGKPAARKGDLGSGHKKCSPTTITSGSPNVFINGKPAARMGDSLEKHCKHGRTIAEGSSTVFINGMPAARVGDGISCGGNIVIGSGNVTIGDNPVLMKPDDFSLPDIDFDKQRGSGGADQSIPYQAGVVSPNDPVYLEHDPLDEQEAIEYKNAIIRIDIPAEHAPGDTFTLSATDGSYSVTKTASDDLIPGDDYIDLLFEQLDTSKFFKLEHTDGDDGSQRVIFDTYNYASIAGLSGDRKAIANEQGQSPHKRIKT